MLAVTSPKRSLVVGTDEPMCAASRPAETEVVVSYARPVGMVYYRMSGVFGRDRPRTACGGIMFRGRLACWRRD